MTWKFGDRIPANQLAAITPEHYTGPIQDNTLPLYHHAGTYDAAVDALETLFRTLANNEQLAGGNIVIVLGPDKGINAYRS